MLVFLFAVAAFADLEISVESKWGKYSEISLKQEVSEYFADIGEFGEFLANDLTLPLGELIDKVSRTPLEKDLIWSTLYNREYSPRLEFYALLLNRTTANCKPFYIINSIHSCELLESLAEPFVDFSSTFDHVVREGQGHIIAYLDISSQEFRETHEKIKNFCQKFGLKFIFRHLDRRENGNDHFGGFGVEVNMKNMEYQPTEDVSAEVIARPKWDSELISVKTVAKALEFAKIEETLKFFEKIPENINDIQKTSVRKDISNGVHNLNNGNVIDI